MMSSNHNNNVSAHSQSGLMGDIFTNNEVPADMSPEPCAHIYLKS